MRAAVIIGVLVVMLPLCAPLAALTRAGAALARPASEPPFHPAVEALRAGAPNSGRGWTRSRGRARAAPARVRASPVTAYPRMVQDLQADARQTPWLRLAVIGKSHEDRALWLVRAADPSGPAAARTTRILVLCRQHGDEPASTEAMLGLLRRVAAGTYRPPRGVTLYLVPMVNPDGAAAGTRDNGVGADLNRDWGIFSQPETRAVAHAATLIRPQVVVDAHNWDGSDHYNANCLEVRRDDPTALGRGVQALEAAGVARLKIAGYTVAATSYGRDADPHLAHRWFTQQGTLSCLVETHSGSPSDAADFQRRQGIYVALIQFLARRYADAWPALDALERLRPTSVREAALFPAPSAWGVRSASSHLAPPEQGAGGRTLWPWAILPYALALFAAFLSRGRAVGTALATAASGRRSGRRTGTRPYPRARYSLPPRPTPAACGRRR